MRLTTSKIAGLLAILTLISANSTAATLPPGFLETSLSQNLHQATGFAFLPDGRAFVIRKGGVVHLVTPYATHAPIDTIPGVFTFGEAGLTGVAVDPAWPVKPFVYFSNQSTSLEKQRQLARRQRYG